MNDHTWDPLEEGEKNETEIRSASQKRQIKNILKSYVGMYDPFSELIQNAMDAVDRRAIETPGHKPEIWFTIDLQQNSFEIIDNGVGFKEKEFRSFLAPNISFKEAGKARGHKGVGATYIAYGFDHLQMATKGPNHTFVGEITQGRAWVEDKEGVVTRPVIRKTNTVYKVFDTLDRGSLFRIKFGDSNTRPKDLSWYQASTAEQWRYLLLTKTPLGVISISGAESQVKFNLSVVDKNGTITSVTNEKSSYLYPHKLIASSVNLDDVRKAQAALQSKGQDSSQVPQRFFKTSGIYEFLQTEELKQFRQWKNTENAISLIEEYKISAYGYFGYSTQIWDHLNDVVARLRKNYRFLKGGLQLANNHMIQGELLVIPLTSDTGYQNQCHIVVHFQNADPDLGRKGFQPELKEIAESISVAIVNRLKSWKRLLKPDTGAQATIDRDTELHNWLRKQEDHETAAPLKLTNEHFFIPTKKISILSTPQSEQDVIVLFSQLLAGGVIRGIKLLATSQTMQYDGVFRFVITPPPEHLQFDEKENPLGIVDAQVSAEKRSPPKILEYKYCVDGLIRDFESGEKTQKDISLVIAWSMGKLWRKSYEITSLIDSANISHREYHGVTHIMRSQNTVLHAIILEELIQYLNDPSEAQRQQERRYSDVAEEA